MTPCAGVLPLLLLACACTPEDTTQEVIAVVGTALGPACDAVEPLAPDVDAPLPSTKRQDVLLAGQAICYVLESPCPGWLAVDARPLAGGSLRLEVHEGFDPRLGHGQAVEESRSHHFELQTIHTYLDAHDPSVQVIRVSREAAEPTEPTPFSLWVAFLPRWRECEADPPDAGDGPHRTAYHPAPR